MRDFSRRVGIPYRTLQNDVGGERAPSSESLGAIGTQTNIDGHWLLIGEGDMLRQAARTEAAGVPGQQQGLDHRLAELRALLKGLQPNIAESILSDALARARTAAGIHELVRVVADLESRGDKRQN